MSDSTVALDALEQTALVKTLPILELEYDATALLDLLWRVSKIEVVEHRELDKAKDAAACWLDNGMPENTEKCSRMFDILGTFAALLAEGEGVFFSAYMHASLTQPKAARVVRTYNEISGAFPPGDVPREDMLAFLHSLGSHLSREVENSVRAVEALKALNETIRSILVSEPTEFRGIMEFADRFLGKHDHAGNPD